VFKLEGFKIWCRANHLIKIESGGKIMKKIKLLSMLVVLTTAVSMLAACSNDKNADEGKSAETITVNFWSAPEQYNYDLWNTYAEKFNNANIELEGSKIVVEVQQMPTQPSSEAGIQNAIATSTVPTISENINRSFAATLASSEAVYDLSKEKWFSEIIEERKIKDVINGWTINDGEQYVIPLYVNPITYIWNSKALRELGATEVPQTLDDFYTLLGAFEENQESLNELGITHFMYGNNLLKPEAWWERWFDFEAQYNAFSQGKSFVEGNKLTLDKEAATKVFDFYGALGSSLLTGEIPQIWQQETVPVIMGVGAPWEIQPNKAAGKVYGMDGDYVYGPTLVEKDGDTHYNFADSKGLVLYKNKNISEKEHQGAIEFLKYVFTGAAKDTIDLDWLNATSMLPVRGDLQTNEIFKNYFGNNPELSDVSGFVADGIPCMANEKMAEILTALAEKGLTPFITEKVVKSKINENPESDEYVNAAFEAMKAVGGLE
jgi:multiple sugar transport system substrate-binding protein